MSWLSNTTGIEIPVWVRITATYEPRIVWGVDDGTVFGCTSNSKFVWHAEYFDTTKSSELSLTLPGSW